MLFELVSYCIVSRVFTKVHGLFVRAIMFQIRRSFKLMLEYFTWLTDKTQVTKL
jgi:hypothetical protein